MPKSVWLSVNWLIKSFYSRSRNHSFWLVQLMIDLYLDLCLVSFFGSTYLVQTKVSKMIAKLSFGVWQFKLEYSLYIWSDCPWSILTILLNCWKVFDLDSKLDFSLARDRRIFSFFYHKRLKTKPKFGSYSNARSDVYTSVIKDYHHKNIGLACLQFTAELYALFKFLNAPHSCGDKKRAYL